MPNTLPSGVKLQPLRTHNDHRGAFTEIFRENWNAGVAPVQWNVVTSEPGVLRGVHVHHTHDDYLLISHGRAQIGLQDLRRGSPTEGLAAVVEMRGDAMEALTIPRGVAHGFYFIEPSMHIYAVSHYWNEEDELGCAWNDPALDIPWTPEIPILSERDRNAGSLAEMMRRLEPYQPVRSWALPEKTFA